MMADTYVAPAKQRAVLIKLWHNDLAEIILQAAQFPEALACINTNNLDMIIELLTDERKGRIK